MKEALSFGKQALILRLQIPVEFILSIEFTFRRLHENHED